MGKLFKTGLVASAIVLVNAVPVMVADAMPNWMQTILAVGLLVGLPIAGMVAVARKFGGVR